ncbi:hypothetical protein pb186bvf_006051 [Paramecium bursaria]
MYQFRQSLYIDPADSTSVKSAQVGSQRQDQVKYFQDQLQVMINYNEKLEKEIKDLKINNEKLKVESYRSNQDGQESLQKTYSKLNVLLTENEKLQEIVINSNKTIKDQSKKIQTLSTENQDLKKQLQQQEELHCEDMRKRTTELETHYQLLQSIVSDLTQQVSQLCQEKEQLQKQIDQMY